MVRFLFWLQHILCIVWFLLLFLFWIFYTYESVLKYWSSIFCLISVFSSQKLFVYDSVFKKTVQPFLVFIFSSMKTDYPYFSLVYGALFFCCWEFSLTFIFISVFDLFISGFHCFFLFDILHVWTCFQKTDHPFLVWFLYFLSNIFFTYESVSKERRSSISCFLLFSRNICFQKPDYPLCVCVTHIKFPK